MPATIRSIEDLLGATFDVNIPLYLDVTSLVQFATWGRDNVAALIHRVRNEGLQIVVFEEQLKKAYPNETYREQAENNLATFEVTFDEITWNDLDATYSTELEGIYFHDEVGNRRNLHSRFLVLARHATSNQHRLRIITAYPAFQRLVDAEIYILPDQGDDVDLPANLDLFIDLGIHPQLRTVVANKLRHNDYIGLVQDGVQELFGYLQSVDPSFAGIDGWDLVDRALGYNRVSVPPRNSLPTTPVVKLSNFGTLAEKDDHKGYYHFFGGAYSTLRNFSGHTAPSSSARHIRFGDKRSAIKILCFLSLLFEKIDQRVP
jgi:hypothetical protein